MGVSVRLLEALYLKRFRPVDDGYLFSRWGHPVHLSSSEVEALVADWRRIWLNPFLWGGWLTLGVALPSWLYLRGSGVAAFMVALLFGVMMLVTLVHAHHRVDQLAEERVPIEAAQSFQGSQPRWPAAVVTAGLSGRWLFEAEGVWVWVLGLMFAVSIGILLGLLWRWWRARSVAA